ncbi:MAG TPA: hypothetical protein VHN18_06485 [Micromonosporaceae bacterium]|nr:hypothetical protein [Micromonosporaceae bacterium]
MFKAMSGRRSWAVVPLVTLTGVLAISPSAATATEKFRFFEETAEAFWAVPHQCADGSTVQATLLVRSTRDFQTPDTEDPDPTARVQYLAVCPGGISFSWAAPTAPATITSTEDLKSVTAAGSGIARDNLGGTHQVSFDVAWTGVGPVETTVNGPGSMRKQREATATGQVTFDGNVLVNGEANHPTRPAPFIRIDIEK